MLASALASVEVYIAHLTEKAKTLEPSTPTPDPSPASFVVGDVVTFKGCSQPMTVVKAGNEYNVILISGKNIAQVIKDIPFAALKKF